MCKNGARSKKPKEAVGYLVSISVSVNASGKFLLVIHLAGLRLAGPSGTHPKTQDSNCGLWTCIRRSSNTAPLTALTDTTVLILVLLL